MEMFDARLKDAKFDPVRIRALTSNPITDTKVVTKEEGIEAEALWIASRIRR